MIDLVARIDFDLVVLRNDRPRSATSFTIDVLDADGRANQFGRVVHITPEAGSGTTMTRVVDSGSGYLSQNQYELLVNSAYIGAHKIDVAFLGFTGEATITGDADVTVYNDGRLHITGLAPNNIIIAGDGDDVLNGGAGDDVILGGKGNDLVQASSGDDVIDGGAGVDRVTYHLPLTYSWKEGRDPDAYFSTKGYLAANPDVAAAGIDPLIHD